MTTTMPDASALLPNPQWIPTLSAAQAMHDAAASDPSGFWLEQAKNLDWITPPTQGLEGSWALPNCSVQWFGDGVVNVSVNCLDRHLAQHGSKPAIIWEGDDPHDTRTLTYHDLYREVCKAANSLRALGVRKGDRVVVYLPMIPEAAIVMLACARLGAIHSVVFGGFSAQALSQRIQDCAPKVVVTADSGYRGGKLIPYKAIVDTALASAEVEATVLVLQHTEDDVAWMPGRDIWWHDIMKGAKDFLTPEPMAAEDPLFILYTSGSTAQPKGLVHTSAGYLLYASLTHRAVFDLRDTDVYFCTADVGWITGHSYGVYGPLANGATVVFFEGTPVHPTAARYWQIIDKHKVTLFYTAPTAIRALMRHGDAPLEATTRSTLRLLGSVGEPLNVEAWLWYFHKVGQGRCPIMDTWWQTETGGFMITPLPGITALKPAWPGLPFPGIMAALMDSEPYSAAPHRHIQGPGEGPLVITTPWPGQARTIWNDHDRFVHTYFAPYPGHYTTGDGAQRDAQGNYRIIGRIDDVMNVSGHRIGTAEVESALNSHPLIAESAVVGVPHAVKGQSIYAFITPKGPIPDPSDHPQVHQELVACVRQLIGPFATPDALQWTESLPKTRSGKIMRRILRTVAAGEVSTLDDLSLLGDISTLANPESVPNLVEGRITGITP